jgi:hypothetical protein
MVGIDDRSGHCAAEKPGDGALAARDDAADGDERRPQERGSLRGDREHEVPTGIGARTVLGSRGQIGRRREEGGDLAAHVRAVAKVEVDDTVEIEVVRFTRVGREQRLRAVDAAVRLEVHGQKGDVGTDVPKPKALVELDAVDDRDPVVVVDIHVLESQIAMPVTHVATAHALLEDRAMIPKELELPSLDLLGRLAAEVARDGLAGLLEVLGDVPGDDVDGAKRRRPAVDPRCGVDPCDRLRHDDEVPRLEASLCEALIGAVAVRQPAHPDGPVDGLPGAIHRMRATQVAGHGHDAEVHVGREPSVEAHLGLAGEPSLLGRAEIEKAEGDGLLDLHDLRRRKEHPRDVGLPELDARPKKVLFERTHGASGPHAAGPTPACAQSLRRRRHGFRSVTHVPATKPQIKGG